MIHFLIKSNSNVFTLTLNVFLQLCRLHKLYWKQDLLISLTLRKKKFWFWLNIICHQQMIALYNQNVHFEVGIWKKECQPECKEPYSRFQSTDVVFTLGVKLRQRNIHKCSSAKSYVDLFKVDFFLKTSLSKYIQYKSLLVFENWETQKKFFVFWSSQRKEST